VLALPLVAATMWTFSFPVYAPGLLGAFLYPIALGALWLVFIAFWIVVLLESTRGFRSWTRHAVAEIWLPTLVLVLGVAIVFFGASLRLRFELSEAELLSIARDPPATRGRSGDRPAGLYTVREYERSANGAVLLMTHDCGASVCGFAYSPRRSPQEICDPYDHQSFEHLAGDWYVFVRDPVCERDDR
jgi:hypothetical protein